MTNSALASRAVFGQAVRPWAGFLILAAALTLASAVCELAPPLLLRSAVDDHLAVGEPAGLLTLAVLYVLAMAGIHGTAAMATYSVTTAAQGALHGIRTAMFAHLQALPTSYFDRNPLGDIISRCTADVDTLDTMFSSGAVRLVADLVRLFTVLAAMVLLSPLLTAASLLATPLVVVITHRLRGRVRAAEQANREAVGALSAHIQETLAGAEVIRAYGAERQLVARFRGALRDVLTAYNTATFFAAFYQPLMTLIAAIIVSLLVWTGTAASVWGGWGVSLGTLTAFVLLFDRFFKPIIALGDEWQTVQGALSGLQRIREVLDLDAERPDRRDAGDEAAPAAGGSRPLVELRDVTFGYLEGRTVLHGVSLSVRPGRHVALVGRTGAGKSSVLHLLGGLYAPWGGAIMVAGVRPASLDDAERRRLIGVVPQVVQLLDGTVRENLSLFDLDLPDAALERAARLAGAERFIATLPHGYDTRLSGSGRGEGLELSAGQRQLMALARALACEPKLILLDEATAAIDSETESVLREALRDRVLASGCAVISVAHRLATAREADEVVVLDDGVVVEAGPPDALEARDGWFAALVQLDRAGWDWQVA
ncbi:MAG: ABC transporter ATP-binding protein [Chloroflexota bacterium]